MGAPPTLQDNARCDSGNGRRTIGGRPYTPVPVRSAADTGGSGPGK